MAEISSKRRSSVPDHGRYDKRIKIEKPTDKVDVFGHRLNEWIEIKSVWAEIRPVGTNEMLAAYQVQSGQTHVVMTHWLPELEREVDGTCRIVFKDRTFNIIGYPRNLYLSNRTLVMDVSEGGADGA